MLLSSDHAMICLLSKPLIHPPRLLSCRFVFLLFNSKFTVFWFWVLLVAPLKRFLTRREKKFSNKLFLNSYKKKILRKSLKKCCFFHRKRTLVFFILDDEVLWWWRLNTVFDWHCWMACCVFVPNHVNIYTVSMLSSLILYKLSPLLVLFSTSGFQSTEATPTSLPYCLPYNQNGRNTHVHCKAAFCCCYCCWSTISSLLTSIYRVYQRSFDSNLSSSAGFIP